LAGALGAAEGLAVHSDAGAGAAEFRVRLLLLRILYNHIRFVLFANLGTMVLGLVLLWEQDNRPWLLAWAAALTALALMRWALARAFRRRTVTPATIGG